ncbi:hypothetical protein ABFS83_06G107300 [Erythranthe nasuta]
MSSGFSGGVPDFFTAGGRSTSRNSSFNTNLNAEQQFPFPPPLPGIMLEPAGQIRRPNFIGKRSLADFQQQSQQGLGFYLRNVKLRPNYQHASIPSISPEVSPMSNSMNSRYGIPIVQQHRLQQLTLPNRNVNNLCTSFFSPNLAGNDGNFNTGMGLPGPGSGSDVFGYESEKKMMSHRLQELEKELLGDDDDGEVASVVTSSEWSETIQNLIAPCNQKSISLSPSSSSSSCCSTSASPPIPCTRQSFVDAAAAISDGNMESAAEILTRLQQVANPRGTSEQRVTAYMVSALKSRMNPTEHPLPVSELHGKEHTLSTQMLYDVSPCFKLGFMAANLAILEAASEQGLHRIHVVDFDIGHGGQYMHFLHALAAKKPDDRRAAVLKITALADSVSGDEEKLKIVGERLKALADKINVCFKFSIKNLNFDGLNREELGVEPAEALAVNFAFRLHKLPDESVTTENFRDEMLRRVKGLSPTVMTVVEQDMNANTAPLTVRVRETCEHYAALFDSLEATVPRENPNRVRVEEALGRKMGNSVAWEGRDRVERCEVFGKWRARMSMAGFQPVPMSQPVADSLRAKLNSGTRGNPGFTVNEESGGICFGWMGRTLAVASAWR